MTLSQIALQHFRLHTSGHWKFQPGVNVIIGENGAGKSSILEAIELLSSGKSVRAGEVKEMISNGQELGRVKVRVLEDAREAEGVGEFDAVEGAENRGIAAQEQETTELELILTRGAVGGKRTASKLWSVNGVRRPQRVALGHLRCVLFRPEDMRLIEGSPGRRRTYYDSTLVQSNRSYASALSTYENVLTRRNKLLEAVREGEQPKTVLHYWTLALLKHGQELQSQRRLYTEKINSLGTKPDFRLHYIPSLLNEARLEEYAHREVAAGHTLIGPHKDDLDLELPPQWRGSLGSGSIASSDIPFSVMKYGSRGQQRLAVLWLKLSQLHYLTAQTSQRPILLLDDIFSELDQDNHHLVAEVIKQGQTIITTTQERELDSLGISTADAAVITL